jgi:D-alanyl-D-alanine carboxypeptidase
VEPPGNPADRARRARRRHPDAGTPAGQIFLLGNSLAGYVDAKSGKRVVFMIAVDNVPLSTPTGVLEVTADQARMVGAIYRTM